MLLEISDLNLWFRIESADAELETMQVLHNVSLIAEKGKITALVGESGSGKSVTALSILRLLDETSDVVTTGSIRFSNHDLLSLDNDQIRRIRGNQIAMIFQEPMTALNPVYPIGNQMIEPLMLHRAMTRAQAEKEAIKLLDRTGITEAAARLSVFPHQLSGGQRQRVMIAMALSCNPKLLIADEPTTALDVTIQAQILNLMQDLQHEYEMGILLITHDLALVENKADQLYIMQYGRVVEQGPTRDILHDPQDPYTQHLLSSVPSGSPPSKEPGPLLLDIRNLRCDFEMKTGWIHPFKRKKKTVSAVDNVSLTLHRGSTCGIVGESGSGKTTLAMALLRLVKSRGEIHFQQKNLQTLNSSEMRRMRSDIQIVFQDPYSSLSPRFTVHQIIEEGLKIHFRDKSGSERNEMVYTKLEEVGLSPEMAWRYPHEFSGGQRQRIAIARVLVLQPRLLILDEPTSALDVTIQAQIIKLLLDLQKRYNMSYLFISHDLRVVRSISDYIAVMQDGKIIESGPAREIFTSPGHDYTRTLFSAALGVNL